MYLSVLLLMGFGVVFSPDICLKLVNKTLSESFSEKAVELMVSLVLSR